MSEISRGEFLGMSAVLAAGVTAGCVPEESTPSGALEELNTADLVVLNGNVLTQDDSMATAEALAVKGGRFVAVGSNDDISNLVAQGRTEVIDAAGMTVLPGFIDAHSHPSYVGLSELKNVNTNLGSIARIQQALRERAARTPPGEWIVGFMYDDTKQEEGRPLSRRDLDEATPDHPVMVNHRGGHTSVVNSMAFQLAGISEETPDPTGGRFRGPSPASSLTPPHARSARMVWLSSPGRWPQQVSLRSTKLEPPGTTSPHTRMHIWPGSFVFG